MHVFSVLQGGQDQKETLFVVGGEHDDQILLDVQHSIHDALLLVTQEVEERWNHMTHESINDGVRFLLPSSLLRDSRGGDESKGGGEMQRGEGKGEVRGEM